MSPKRRKTITIICVMIGTVMSAIAYASGTQHIAYPIISRIWNLFISVAFMAGILTTAAAVIQMVQAFKDEDAEKKVQAIKLGAVGLGLMGFQLLLDPVLGALGFFR